LSYDTDIAKKADLNYLDLISHQKALQLTELCPEGLCRSALSFRKVSVLTSPATSLADKVSFDLERAVPAASCLRQNLFVAA